MSEEGVTLPKLRAEVGMEYAEWQLRETDHSIARIAETAGFGDAAAFARAFRRYSGMTPSQVRKGAPTPESVFSPSQTGLAAPAPGTVKSAPDRQNTESS